MEHFNNGCKSGEKHNEGIVCDVKNCEYHSCETYCTKDEISVGPRSATCSAETACASFKQKEN